MNRMERKVARRIRSLFGAGARDGEGRTHRHNRRRPVSTDM